MTTLAQARQVNCECGTAAELKTGATVYPHRPDLAGKLIYVCPKDGFRVGCHAGTTTPLGTPASPETQKARRAAHAAFDVLWARKMRKDNCSKSHARGAGYRWLSDSMGIPAKDTHIGMMTREQALEVVRLCQSK